MKRISILLVVLILPFTAVASSRVIIVTDSHVFNASGTVNQKILRQMVNTGVKAFFHVKTAKQGWKKSFNQHDRIAIKVNALNAYFAPRYATYQGITHPELVGEIARGLMSAGVKPHNIVVFDRRQLDINNKNIVDVMKLGHYAEWMPKGVRVEDGGEFGPTVKLSDKVKLNFLKQLYWSTKMINAPVLKAHPAMGLSFALKNNFGSFKPAGMKTINGATQYSSAYPLHMNGGIPGFRLLNSFPPIKNKTKLIIGDALRAQYRAHYYDPEGSWKANAIIIGSDPVAVDRVAWHLLQKERSKRKVNYYIGEPLANWYLQNKKERAPFIATPTHMFRGGVAGAYIHDCAIAGLGTDNRQHIDLKIIAFSKSLLKRRSSK